MAVPSSAGELEIDGRRLAIRNLDRVIFPRTGTTKADLLNYYCVRIGGAMLPHLRKRLLQMHRISIRARAPGCWTAAR